MPGDEITRDPDPAGTTGRTLQANDAVVMKEDVQVDQKGKFSGEMILPAHLQGGKYLLKAVSIDEGHTYVTTHSVYLGWMPLAEVLLSMRFIWLVLSGLLIFLVIRFLFPVKKTDLKAFSG